MILEASSSSTSSYLRFRGQASHESCCSISGIVLFDEGDGGVDDQQNSDAKKVLPIRGPPSTISQGDGHDGGHLHDPGQGIPHEPEKLEELAFL